MAADGTPVPAGDVDMVVTITGFEDRGMIRNALRNRGNVESVINEYLDDPDKFRRQYGWDESAFSSGREGEDALNTSINVPAFAIHSPVIYGTEPSSGFYGAPSRPPSRANNRSPMSRLTDLTTAGEYTTDAPSNRQEEEAHLQRAINESLNTSVVPTAQMLPPPFPPPPPQQSGVTSSSGETSVYFGPANRPDYDPDEWAMVRLGNQESDPEPSLRARKPGLPVFLRCRQEAAWSKHRLGALLMIFQQIPAARNALLQCGKPPDYGYGNKSDWWQGKPILPPGHPETGGWGNSAVPPWSDELHRLMAFLESSDRAYGTADNLARATDQAAIETGDVERDFFHSVCVSQSPGSGNGNKEALISTVEAVTLDDLTPQGSDWFGLLDLLVSKDAIPVPKIIYDVLDWVFLADLRMAGEDPSNARMALVQQASGVLTFRFQGDDGLPGPIEMPETFYIDRYISRNGPQMQELQMDMITLLTAYDDLVQREEALIRWINPKTNKAHDRRVLSRAAARRCQERIAQVKKRAFWRDHEQAVANGDGEYYLPDHAGEPRLLPEEARVVAHYEAKIRELDESMVEIERVMNEQILPRRQAIQEVMRRMASLLTGPSPDEKWNATHAYTLRGVVNEANTVYLRIRGPVGEPRSESAENDPVQVEDRWWKVSFKSEDNTVEQSPVSFETVMREACGVGSLPILVYATDKAMEQEKVPLSDALRSFVKLDNRHFKNELAQSARFGQSPDKKRSAVLGDDSQSKRLQRSASMDSLATNHASAGDFEDFMRDSPFDNDYHSGQAGGTPAHESAGQDESIPELTGEAPAVDHESARLAQVLPLQDVKISNSPPRPPAPEMQERPNAQLLMARPTNRSAANGGAASAADDGEPLIDLSSDQKDVDAGLGPAADGV
ncbi:dbf9ddb2-e043-46af-839e-a9911abff68d [Thermothielavioides terrestris]|uniref:Dbf9ddb2-e043-46af-839e-a9911abff68d n=1 Tax=Thermothielavioides terrestris TaxID=2587410 RepID=A0A446BGQ1_9PEZI|nr:dbf9ddb2-e043-46af-839e-a9911abff68d [Thermothielavioides terrestris]